MIEDFLSEKQKKKKKRRRRLWWRVGVLLVCAVGLCVVWVITESPVLRIDHFAVAGNQAVSSGDVTTLLLGSMSLHRTFWSSILGINNMLIWPKALRASDVALVPQLADVAIEKDYMNHTLTASVTERIPLAIWCEMPGTDANGNPSGDESCFWFDNTGTLFQKAFDTEGSELFAIHDYTGDRQGFGEKILPDIFVPNILSILGTLKASGLIVKEIALNDLSLEEVDASIYNGPTLYFSLRFSAADILPVLQQIIGNQNFNSLQYVDFRTENRVYYK